MRSTMKPISVLKNKTADLVREVSKTGKPVVITQHGEAKAVLMDIATYERWQDALALLKLVAQGESDVRAGRTIPQEKAFAAAAAALERARRADSR